MKRAQRFLVVVFLSMIVLAVAPVAVGAESSGSSPLNAISLSASTSGTLDPYQTRWYHYANAGSGPIGITMDFSPPTSPTSSNVYFNVDWATPEGSANVDWPGYYRLGQGTQSGLPQGRRYWMSTTSSPGSYSIEVVNWSEVPVSYAIGLTGSVFPPPVQSIGSSQAAPTPTQLPIASASATSTPVPSAMPNSATDRSGLVLNPRITVDGPFSTVALRLDSASDSQVHIDRVIIRPPANAVVDGVSPVESRNEGGVAWYTNVLVDRADPLTGFWVRVFGPANGAVVEVDWSTASDKGVLMVTVAGAPVPSTLVP